MTFISGSSDDVALPTTAGTISWDLDNDGQFDDGTAATATRAYTSAGDQTVRMRVQDAGGLVTIASRTFPVQQFQPTASFTSSPAHPLPGQTVTFRSTEHPLRRAPRSPPRSGISTELAGLTRPVRWPPRSIGPPGVVP